MARRLRVKKRKMARDKHSAYHEQLKQIKEGAIVRTEHKSRVRQSVQRKTKNSFRPT